MLPMEKLGQQEFVSPSDVTQMPWDFPVPSSWEMFIALGCTLHLMTCIMMLIEGAAFEYAGKNVIPDSDQIKAAAVKRICSLSREGKIKRCNDLLLCLSQNLYLQT